MSATGKLRELGQRVSRRDGLRRAVENVSWLFVERMLVLALNFAVSVWFINYLGVLAYGKYAYAVSFAALFGVLASLGLDTIVVRELSVDDRKAGEVLGTAFVLRAVASLVTLGLICLAAFLVAEDPTTRILVVIVAAGILADPSKVVDLWFEARIESKYVVWLRAGVTLTGVLVRVLLILAGAPLVGFAWLVTAQAAALGIGLAILFVRRRPAGLVLRHSARRAWLLLGDAWPLIIAGLSVTIYQKIDRIMLGEMLGDRAVGTYSTAATISEVWNLLPVAITTSLFPIIVRSKESGDPRTYARRMQALYDLMALFGYAVAVVLTLLGPWLVSLLFTEEYGPAARILQLHIWSLVFVGLGTARSRYLITENRVRFAMMATLAGCLLNLAANWVLIPRHGGVGAALATLISYSVAAYFSGFFARSAWATTGQMTRALLAPFRPAQVIRQIREIL